MVVCELVRKRLGYGNLINGLDFGTANHGRIVFMTATGSVGKVEEEAMIITCTTELAGVIA